MRKTVVKHVKILWKTNCGFTKVVLRNLQGEGGLTDLR